jgi:hypothetical protein
MRKMSEAEKAKAFDKIYADLKKSRDQTNLDDWTIFLDKVLKKFDWELIKMKGFDRCVVCDKPLSIEVATWAHKKKVKWFCQEHYADERLVGNETIMAHDRSFRRMVKKTGGTIP